MLPASVEILPGTSSKNLFNIYGTSGGYVFDALTQYPNALQQMERSKNFTVTFQTPKNPDTSDIMPHSLQAVFTHTAGVGVSMVINPRGDLKNVIWSDDGTNLKVMVTPPDGKTLINAIDLKFYVAGGITSFALVPSSLKAYDINGQLMAGVTANIQ